MSDESPMMNFKIAFGLDLFCSINHQLVVMMAYQRGVVYTASVEQQLSDVSFKQYDSARSYINQLLTLHTHYIFQNSNMIMLAVKEIRAPS